MARQTYARMSLYYFFFYTTIAVFAPYFNLYLASRGLSSEQVGMVLAVIPLGGILMQPLWGMMNDRLQIQKTTIFLALVVPAITLLLYPHLHSFPVYVLGTAVLAVFQSVAVPVADSMTIETAGTGHYGKIRLFGSLGYAIAAAIAAALYKHYGVSEISVVYGFTVVLALFGLIFYPKPAKMHSGHQRPALFSGMIVLLSNKKFLLILCFTLLITISQAVNSNFFTLYYHALGRPMGWLGIIYALGALSELPFFFIIGRFIGKYGAERIFLLGGAIFLLRWIVLCFEPPTWVIVMMQLSHGLSFTLTFTAGVSMAAQASARDNQVTAQTVYNSVNMGLSAIIGSLIGGVVLNQFGPRGLYGFAAAICVLGLIAMFGLIRSTSARSD
ncbi:MFS transporter [Alicyclobacillus sp. SO9]|uniref:MFS transporter n=1 Tax=Alicyclobacillus sp. SO9 TaxID=2665646 RepID=UPI0018E8A603|nr:MFS transporter [Alicyclobacillus sp. SO9]QQE79249.1 MFS transporter [Alicyclobacillus sp. SO9]